MNIFVGNLPSSVTESGIRQAFEVFGNAGSMIVIKDRYTGESKGFCFVEMADQSEACIMLLRKEYHENSPR